MIVKSKKGVEKVPRKCSRPPSEIWMQKLKSKDCRLEQSLRWINPESVTSEPERSTDSKDDPWEAMTSIHLSFTPGYCPRQRSCQKNVRDQRDLLITMTSTTTMILKAKFHARSYLEGAISKSFKRNFS